MSELTRVCSMYMEGVIELEPVEFKGFKNEEVVVGAEQLQRGHNSSRLCLPFYGSEKKHKTYLEPDSVGGCNGGWLLSVQHYQGF